MRPLHLEMTAFGSYAEKTVLNFEELKSKLYLITGDTGAGKTTIFDAIMFALFGVASGADRKTDMLHCDYVPKSEDTVVKLRFEQDGRAYTVERKLHFSKKRGTADQYGDAKPSATLWEPERAPTEGAEKVTARCEALLGLNAEQFGRIIMLAQGEFKKFLKADSNEKNAILGKLFDNSDYLYYQNLLLGARDELKRRREESKNALHSLMEVTFRRPESFHGLEQEAFLPEHPALLENLQQLLNEEREALTAAGTAREEAFAALHTLSERLGEAATMNKLLDDLRQARERLDELTALDGEMAQRRELLSRRETALHKALPVIKKAQEAGEALNLTLSEIVDLRIDLAESSQAVEDAKAAVEADAPLQTDKDTLEQDIHTIEQQIPRYEELEKQQREKQQAESAKAKAAQKRQEAEAARDHLAQELNDLRRKLEELEGIDGELVRCNQAYDQAKTRLEALAGKTGLRAEVAGIRKRETALDADKEELVRLTEEAADASAHAEALYQTFIAAQAAVLALDLRKALETQEEAPCPVCGSRLHRGQLAQLAVLPEETPDKDAVDTAKREKEAAEKARSSKEASLREAMAKIEADKQAAVSRAAALLPDCDSWEALSAPGYLETAIDAARQNTDKGKAALDAATVRASERDTAKAQSKAKEQAQKQAEDAITTNRTEEQTQAGRITAADTAIGILRAQLPDEDKRLAEQKKADLERRVREIDRQLKQHLDALKEKEQKNNQILGSLTEKETTAEKQTTAHNAALSERDRVLEETGFDSAQAVALLLEPLDGQDAEAWLAAERDALSGHENSKNNTRDRIKTLQEQTAGKQPVDLAALEAKKQQLNQRHEEANNACMTLDVLLNNHQAVYDRAKSLTEVLSGSKRAWERLDRLAALAGGVSGEGGKLSFDRYVMGAMFREILEMANRRMELMSGGRYELVHKVSADKKNAKAGLEIEVLDNNTGLQRPSGSLSGGETFFTSLALALGLSDTVQNHAGGKQMDALFIDEGFGTLSDDVLDKALEVLRQLTEGNRLVGIISHVDKLDESIPQKIRVRHGEKGSSLKPEFS